MKKAVNICRLKLFYSAERKKFLHFSDNSIFQTCSPSITCNLSRAELPSVSTQDPISNRSHQAFKRPMRIQSSIEDVGTLDSTCLPGIGCNESTMIIPECLTVGNVGFLNGGEVIASVENSNTHSRAVFGEDLNSVLSLFNQALKNEHDAGNWMRTTINAFSHPLPQYLDTTEGIIQSFSCSSDAVQNKECDEYKKFATSSPLNNSTLLMPFNCMSFSPNVNCH